MGTVLPTTVATTLCVNVLGSLALGAIVATSLDAPIALVLGVGFCGAFTIFSSFAVETVRLAEANEALTAAAYAIGTFVAAIAAVIVGGWLATLVA